MDQKKPIIGVTMGDPAGIGPEITVKLALEKTKEAEGQILLIGDTEIVEATLRKNQKTTKVIQHTTFQRESFAPQHINVYDPSKSHANKIIVGEVSELAGEVSMLFNRNAANLAMDGAIDAIVTAPVTKASAKLAGYDYAGQAEYFAKLAGNQLFTTILIYREFKAALFTTHLPLKQACEEVKREKLIKKIKFLHERRKDLGYPDLRMAIASLNPHAGERGTMGREEIEEIEPAIKFCQNLGIDLTGPFPVNALISPPYDGRNFDLTLALYHDQVVSRMNMLETTTLTFGLPFIRTSVGHGSALDIAGKNMADTKAIGITYDHTLDLARLRLRANVKNKIK